MIQNGISDSLFFDKIDRDAAVKTAADRVGAVQRT